MKAFHGDNEVKKKYLDRVTAHRKADEIVKGQYWEDGKGCGIGCTIHSGDHAEYEPLLGIPEWLAHLEDRIFEGLPNDRAKFWPEQFLEAIPIGVELDKVKGPFLIFVLQSTLGTLDHDKYPNILQSINSVIDLYIIGEATEEDFREAANAASAYASSAAAAAAYSRAFSAAYAAASYAAYAASAASAAYAYAAAYAASAAASAAAYAAASADASYAASADASAAYAAAREPVYVKFADKLIELLRAA